MLRLVLLFLSVFILQSALATTVYKYVDEQGNTVYTDEPRKGAEVLDVQPIPTMPAIRVPPAQPKAAPTAAFRYHKILIVSPENQHNFVNEPGPISIQVALSPALRKGDQLQLLLNGAAHGSPVSSTEFTLENLDRGTYSASVKALDENSKELGSSATIEFFVKRHSVNLPGRK